MLTRIPLSLLTLMAVAAMPVAAQTVPDEDVPAQSDAAKAAATFALDLPADPDTAAPAAEPVAATAPGEPRFTADTPIEQIIADPRARAVLDRDIEDLSKDRNLPKFRKLSLRMLAKASGGQLTPELLAKADADLRAIK